IRFSRSSSAETVSSSANSSSESDSRSSKVSTYSSIVRISSARSSLPIQRPSTQAIAVTPFRKYRVDISLISFYNERNKTRNGVVFVNTVQPIRDRKQIDRMKRVLSPRDRLMFVIGINSGLRISDILRLKVGDIRGQEFITIREKKTGKAKRFRINNAIKREFKRYEASV